MSNYIREEVRRYLRENPVNNGAAIFTTENPHSSAKIQAAIDAMEATDQINNSSAVPSRSSALVLGSGSYPLTTGLETLVYGLIMRGAGMSTRFTAAAGITALTVGTSGATPNASYSNFKDFAIYDGAVGIRQHGIYYGGYWNIDLHDQTTANMIISSAGLGQNASNLALFYPKFFGAPIGIQYTGGMGLTSLFHPEIGADSTGTGISYESTGWGFFLFGGAFHANDYGMKFSGGNTTYNISMYGTNTDGINVASIDTGDCEIYGLLLANVWFRPNGSGSPVYIDKLGGAKRGQLMCSNLWGPVDLGESDTSLSVVDNTYATGNSTLGGGSLRRGWMANYNRDGGIVKREMKDYFELSDHFGGAALNTFKWRATQTAGTPVIAHTAAMAGGSCGIQPGVNASDDAILDNGGFTVLSPLRIPVIQIAYYNDSEAELTYSVYMYQDASNWIGFTKLNSTSVQLQARAAASTTSANISITDHTTMKVLRFEVSPTRLQLYKNNTVIATLTTGIPTGLFYPRIRVIRSSGTTSAMNVDFFDVRQTREDVNFAIA